MTITYNDKTYTVIPDSVYYDFSISVSTLEEACDVVRSFDGVTDYIFNVDTYTNMIVVKRSIVVGDEILVRVKLRKKTEAELAKEELEALRQAMISLAETTNKTTTAKINKILDKEV